MLLYPKKAVSKEKPRQLLLVHQGWWSVTISGYVGFPGSILTPVYWFLSKVELHAHSKGCDGSDLFYLHHPLGLGNREFLQRKLDCGVTLNNFQQNCQEIKKQVLQPPTEGSSLISLWMRGIWSQQSVTTHTADFHFSSSKTALKLGTGAQGAASPGQALGSMHFQALWQHQPLPKTQLPGKCKSTHRLKGCSMWNDKAFQTPEGVKSCFSHCPSCLIHPQHRKGCVWGVWVENSKPATSPWISPFPAGAACSVPAPSGGTSFICSLCLQSHLVPNSGSLVSSVPCWWHMELSHRGTFLSLKGISLIKVTKIRSEAHK